jgi:ABC-type nickel/cobalt efflux system permease component RcnA
MASWSKFRRGLRKDDQEAFDDVFRAARLHLAENFYAMRTIPFESLMMSIVVEQQKTIRRLEEELQKLKT